MRAAPMLTTSCGPDHMMELHQMAKHEIPSPEELRNILRYEPETGKLFWLERAPSLFDNAGRSAAHKAANWNSRYAGQEAFTARNRNGYLAGAVRDRMYPAHRVIWALYYGKWPDGQIDYINHDRADNRIANLRDIPQAENKKNQRRRIDNTSGITGVSRVRQSGKWRASIQVSGKMMSLGVFDTVELAVNARRRAERAYGFHENHGKPHGGTVAFECSDSARKFVRGE